MAVTGSAILRGSNEKKSGSESDLNIYLYELIKFRHTTKCYSDKDFPKHQTRLFFLMPFIAKIPF